MSVGTVFVGDDAPAPGWMARAGVGNINENARMVAANPKHSSIKQRVQNIDLVLAFLARSKSIGNLRCCAAASWDVVFVAKRITGKILLVQRHRQLALTMIFEY